MSAPTPPIRLISTHSASFQASIPPDHSAHSGAATPHPVPRKPLGLWPMLLALLSAFALSQSYRTVTAIIATGLQNDFGLSSSSLGAFAGLFGLAFGVMQFFMGIGMDLYGLRRTVLSAFPLAIAGAALSAWAPQYGWLLLGQALIGVGCAPAFLACTMFIARHFPSSKFAFMSGVGLGVGGLGLLFTGTPLAWLVQSTSWRMGFVVLAVLSALSWLLIWRCVHEPALATPTPERESWGAAVRRFGALFTMPHTWGILLLGMVGYAAFLSLRGLWIGPLLIERYGFSLVESGNAALVMSFISLFSPAYFGRLDPGPTHRRNRIVNFSLLVAVLYLAMGFVQHAALTVALVLLIAMVSGYSVLQYSDVRSSYPTDLIGRALSVFTMAMFLGVGLMQWLTGLVAGWAQAQGLDPYMAVMTTIAVMLALGSCAFRWLPASPLLEPQK